MNRRELFAGLFAAPVALAGAAKAAQGSDSPLRAVLGTSEKTVSFPFVQTQEHGRRIASRPISVMYWQETEGQWALPIDGADYPKAPVREDLEWSVPHHATTESPWA